jgi:hypothetical protein
MGKGSLQAAQKPYITKHRGGVDAGEIIGLMGNRKEG